ncbi:MAG TPA: hypothetical protein EYP41_10830, partial [Anaerolineae bacterium]|nr:hypothetical protein [Anaerolineae bacterium]
MAKEIDVEAVVTAVKQSRKYGDTSEETIRELAEEAARQYKKPKAAVKAVRTQLHSIMAPYLGDPDYALEAARLNEAFAAQVLACKAAWNDADYCKTHFDLDQPLGEIPDDRLNIDGGGVSLGHPVGA